MSYAFLQMYGLRLQKLKVPLITTRPEKLPQNQGAVKR
jgi:hypothetical protein